MSIYFLKNCFLLQIELRAKILCRVILVPAVLTTLIQRLSNLFLVTDLPIEQQIESEAQRLVLSKISKRDLKILCLRILEEQTFMEIAVETGLSYSMVQASYYWLIKKIKTEFGDENK